MSSVYIQGNVARLFKRMKKLSNIDKKAINQVMGEAVRESTIQRFKEEKDPDGKSWKKSMRASLHGKKTLTASASLRNSIRTRADASGFAVGTNKVYAATHQFGAKNRKIVVKAKTSRGLIFKIGDRWIRKRQVTVTVNIPARPFLGISEEDMKELQATLDEALMEE